jgi:hypothetical protein
VKQHSRTEIKKLIEYYEKHAKQQEDGGQFDTVFHEQLDMLKKELKKTKKGKSEKPKDIQAELKTPEYGDK